MVSLAKPQSIIGAGAALKAVRGSVTPSTHLNTLHVPHYNTGRLARLPAELLHDILEDLVAASVDFLVTHADPIFGGPPANLPGAPPVMLLWVSRALRAIATKTFAHALGATPDATGSFTSNPWLAVRPVRAAYLGLPPHAVPPSTQLSPLLQAYGALASARRTMSWYPQLSPLKVYEAVPPALYGPLIVDQTTVILYAVALCTFLRASERARVLRRARKCIRFASIVMRLWTAAMRCRQVHEMLLDLEPGTTEYDEAATALIGQIREATLEEDCYIVQVSVFSAAGDSGHGRSSSMLSKAIAHSGVVAVLDSVRWCPDTPDTITLEAHAAVERWAVLLPDLGLQSVLSECTDRDSEPIKPLRCFHAKRQLAACIFGQAKWRLDQMHGYADGVASRKADGVYEEVVRDVIRGATGEIGWVLEAAGPFLSWKGERCLSDLAEMTIWRDLALLRWKMR